jgi:murein DD-endopeptidase MepM/ murein hydrolase activator NlpD
VQAARPAGGAFVYLRAPNGEGGSTTLRARRRLTLVLVALALPGASSASDELAFAPVGALHDDRVLYRLPYPLDVPRYVSQGVGDPPTHQDALNFHAFDFSMTSGSPVLAAREGVVGHVVDGQPPDSKLANEVLVLHADGTFAGYTHLQAGVAVKQGQKVERGQLLGRCGTSGMRGTRGHRVPHLHFAVMRRMPGHHAVSVPIRFEGPGGQPVVPKTLSWYGQPPRPTVALRLRSESGALDPRQHVPLRPGQSLPLHVELVDAASGRVRDVTADPKTRFFPMSLFNLDVSASGVVSARPTPGFEASPNTKMRNAALFVIHGREGDAEVGHATIFFWIDPSGRLPEPTAAPAGAR